MVPSVDIHTRAQKIEWFKLSDLPTWKRSKQVPGKFYLISPFVPYVVGYSALGTDLTVVI